MPSKFQEDLEESIRWALVEYPPGHPERGVVMSNIAAGLGVQYERIGARSEVERGLLLKSMTRLLMDALGLCPPDHIHRVNCLNNLANALSCQFEVGGLQDDPDWKGPRNNVKRRISLLKEALELSPSGSPNRPVSLNNLAKAHRHLYELTGSRDDLERRIQLHKESVELCADGHPNLGLFLSNLADALSSRYDITGSEEDLEERIRLLTAAMELRPPGHPDRSGPLANLACALSDRYNRTGSLDDLDESIRLLTENVKISPFNSPGRGIALNNLANGLYRRYDRTGREDDIQRMIDLHREALHLRDPGHPDRVISLHNLAVALNAQYNHTSEEASRQEVLSDSIQLYRDTLELSSPESPDYDMYAANLANALFCRYDCTNSQSVLEEAIQLHTMALGHYRLHPNHPGLGGALNNLANSLSRRCDLTNAQADIEQTIKLRKECVDAFPNGHPLHALAVANLAADLRRIGDPTANTEIARLLKEGATDRISPFKDSLRCTALWIKHGRETNHNTLGEAYDHSIQYLRHYLTIGPTVKLQYDALAKEPGMLSLPMDAASHAIENNDPKRAIELLDAGRSLLWSEMRRFRENTLQLELTDKNLTAKFSKACNELQALSMEESRVGNDTRMEPRPRTMGKTKQMGTDSAIAYESNLLSRKRTLLRDYEATLTEIRKKAGMENFLRNMPFEKLKEAAKEGPVIIINCSGYGSHAIIIFAHRSDPTVVSLDEGVIPLNPTDEEKRKSFFLWTFDIHKRYLVEQQKIDDAQDKGRALNQMLSKVTQQLWDGIVTRIIPVLEEHGTKKRSPSRIWWCPTSYLTILPLHAAGNGKTYLIDRFISSYTPTLKALIDARQRRAVSLSSEPAFLPTILVIAQVKNSGLPSARIESDVMREFGHCVEHLVDQNATRQAVLEKLQTHNWVHFICHGTLSNSPFDSYLKLYHNEDKLSLLDIIQARLPTAKFAFLAACHTAEQGQTPLRDEVLHLAGAMQFSGFQSVVGTMWEMVDKDGPGVAREFYKKMLHDGWRTRTAHGIWEATREMRKRHKSLGEVVEFCTKRLDQKVGNGDGGVEERHERAARALWEVTREMKRRKASMESWMNFVHIGA